MGLWQESYQKHGEIPQVYITLPFKSPFFQLVSSTSMTSVILYQTKK